ncbi:MAG: DUF6531 domain-containing protein, partial [Bacteroidota bacterium]
MIAAKMLDTVMGIDIHIIQPPGPVPPVPIPHPFIGMVMDPMEFVPFIGASVIVNGLPRAQAGNEAMNVPHIPIGGTFIKPIDNEGEIFMGSSTVVVEDEPFSRLGSPVLSCSCIGMPSPPRPKGEAKAGLKLPTSVLLAAPGGQLVLVGGPPTISLMAIGMKVAMFAGGKFFNKFIKNSGPYKALCKKVHDAASTVTKHLPDKWAKKAHNSICDTIGHPVDVATGKVFTDRVDFTLPGLQPFVWERVWYSASSLNGCLGHGWHHSYDLHLSISDNGSLNLRMPDGRNTFVPYLHQGEEAYVEQEKLRFENDGTYFVVTDENYQSYRFLVADIDKHSSATLHSILRAGAPEIGFSYSAKGYLQQITDSAGRKLRVSTDAKGRITKVEVPHPNPASKGRYVAMVQYRYDEFGDLVESIDALGNSFQYTYENHLLVRETNRNGLSFYFEYEAGDGYRRCLRTWGDEGIHDNTLSYNLEAKTTRVINSLGHATIYHWNDDGVVWKTIDPLGHESIRQYG